MVWFARQDIIVCGSSMLKDFVICGHSVSELLDNVHTWVQHPAASPSKFSPKPSPNIHCVLATNDSIQSPLNSSLFLYRSSFYRVLRCDWLGFIDWRTPLWVLAPHWSSAQKFWQRPVFEGEGKNSSRSFCLSPRKHPGKLLLIFILWIFSV